MSSNAILQNKNSHPRDDFIKFYNKGHKYEITCDPGVKYTSVTTWNHNHFPKFDADAIIENIFKSKDWGPNHKYWGLTAEQIKEGWKFNGNSAASAGTNLHERIELFMNSNKFKDNEYTQNELYELYINNYDRFEDDQVEWNYFIQFVKDHPHLKPYRTEWMIFDEDLKIAGSIDMVYENPDGTLSIYDWKRSKNITRINNFNKFAISPLICHLPDSNFWHYALQLNTYKVILEEKYGKKVKDLYLVRLHPDAEEKNYELIKLPDLSKDVIDLLKERKRNL